MISARFELHPFFSGANTTLASLLIMGCLSVGCAGLPLETTGKPKSPPKKMGTPTQIVLTANACWMQVTETRGQSGFFCRMYFFDGDDPVPISINGELNVVAFDAAKDGSPEKPQGVYTVKSEEMNRHYRPDIVGDAYAFWFQYHTTEPVDLQVQATLTLKTAKRSIAVGSKFKSIQLPLHRKSRRSERRKALFSSTEPIVCSPSRRCG